VHLQYKFHCYNNLNRMNFDTFDVSGYVTGNAQSVSLSCADDVAGRT
jgi:hypothetical protein